MTTVYFDACCLNRPFDDQSQERIRREADAVLRIISRCASGEWLWLSSDLVSLELGRTADRTRRERLLLTASSANRTATVGPAHHERARYLRTLGFKSADALHLACAEAEAADLFLSTDDQLLRLVARVSDQLRVAVTNPLRWIEEVEGR